MFGIADYAPSLKVESSDLADDKDEKQNWKKTNKKVPVKSNVAKGKKNDKKGDSVKGDGESDSAVTDFKEEDVGNEVDITNMEVDFETTEIKEENEVEVETIKDDK